MQVRRERAWIVGHRARLERRAVAGDDLGVDLGIPDHLEPLALRVVVHAGEAHDGRGFWGGDDVFDEVRTLAHADEGAGVECLTFRGHRVGQDRMPGGWRQGWKSRWARD